MVVFMGMIAQHVGMAVDVQAGRIAACRPAVIQCIEIIAGFCQEIPVMGDNHAGDVQLIDNGNQADPGIGIKIIGRLIQQQGLGLHGENGCQRHQFFSPPDS